MNAEYAMGDALLLQAAFRMEEFSDGNSTSDYKVAGRYSLEETYLRYAVDTLQVLERRHLVK